MKKMLGSIALAALLAASCSPKAIVADTPAPAAETAAAPVVPAIPAPSIEGIPAGDYKLDPEHSTFFFRVNHLSFSKFTLWYDTFSADLKLDPANPSAAVMNASIDPASLTVHAPSKGFLEHLKSKDYLDAAGFPSITFKSTQIKLTGPNTADVTGDLTLHGITKPLTLQMTYNGGYAGHVYEPRARIGFSGHGVFKRSDFGIGGGVPQPGSTMGVFDEVEVILETEWLGPPWKDAPPAAPASN
jgi:polyisoprenoid-binding protein YceI